MTKETYIERLGRKKFAVGGMRYRYRVYDEHLGSHECLTFDALVRHLAHLLRNDITVREITREARP